MLVHLSCDVNRASDHDERM